jgi:hypothetical protein
LRLQAFLGGIEACRLKPGAGGKPACGTDKAPHHGDAIDRIGDIYQMRLHGELARGFAALRRDGFHLVQSGRERIECPVHMDGSIPCERRCSARHGHVGERLARQFDGLPGHLRLDIVYGLRGTFDQPDSHLSGRGNAAREILGRVQC